MKLGPNIWGPHGWKFIHYIAFAYPNNPPDNVKETYKNFFTLLGNVLPCKLCMDHYAENLILHPLTDKVLTNRDTLLQWTIDIHNEVNKINNSKLYDYNSVMELLMNNFASEETKPNTEPNNKVTNITEPNKVTNNITKNNKKDNEDNDNKMLYIFILLFIILVICACVYKKK